MERASNPSSPALSMSDVPRSGSSSPEPTRSPSPPPLLVGDEFWDRLKEMSYIDDETCEFYKSVVYSDPLDVAIACDSGLRRTSRHYSVLLLPFHTTSIAKFAMELTQSVVDSDVLTFGQLPHEFFTFARTSKRNIRLQLHGRSDPRNTISLTGDFGFTMRGDDDVLADLPEQLRRTTWSFSDADDHEGTGFCVDVVMPLSVFVAKGAIFDWVLTGAVAIDEPVTLNLSNPVTRDDLVTLHRLGCVGPVLCNSAGCRRYGLCALCSRPQVATRRGFPACGHTDPVHPLHVVETIVRHTASLAIYHHPVPRVTSVVSQCPGLLYTESLARYDTPNPTPLHGLAMSMGVAVPLNVLSTSQLPSPLLGLLAKPDAHLRVTACGSPRHTGNNVRYIGGRGAAADGTMVVSLSPGLPAVAADFSVSSAELFQRQSPFSEYCFFTPGLHVVAPVSGVARLGDRSVRRALAERLSSVQAGKCYRALTSPAFPASEFRAVGTYPTVETLVRLPYSWFDYRFLVSYRVRFVSDLTYHVSAGDEGVVALDFFIQYVRQHLHSHRFEIPVSSLWCYIVRTYVPPVAFSRLRGSAPSLIDVPRGACLGGLRHPAVTAVGRVATRGAAAPGAPVPLSPSVCFVASCLRSPAGTVFHPSVADLRLGGCTRLPGVTHVGALTSSLPVERPDGSVSRTFVSTSLDPSVTRMPVAFDVDPGGRDVVVMFAPGCSMAVRAGNRWVLGAKLMLFNKPVTVTVLTVRPVLSFSFVFVDPPTCVIDHLRTPRECCRGR